MQWIKLVEKRRVVKRLAVELTPTSLRSQSLFQTYLKNKKIKEWSEIKEELIEKEGAKCWICGRETLQLHIHEFWIYDDFSHEALLKEIHHLCGLCHKIKRTDLWFFTTYGKKQLKELGLCREDLIKHYCKVNKCALKDFAIDWREAVSDWRKRCENHWNTDLGNYHPIFLNK